MNMAVRFAPMLVGVLAALAPLPAAAAVLVDLTKGFSAAAGSPSVYEVNNDFTLPADAIDPVLKITRLAIDDRGVVLLNGVPIDNSGIFGPGNGFLTLTPGGPNDPFTFTGENGARNTTITTGFVTGLNSFRIIVNDTSAGISGAPLPGGVFRSDGGIVASLSYGVAAAVPEPGTWAMMIVGFGLVGGAIRRRRSTPGVCTA